MRQAQTEEWLDLQPGSDDESDGGVASRGDGRSAGEAAAAVQRQLTLDGYTEALRQVLRRRARNALGTATH
eukprot:COSAG01_NODE_690_length_14219_cov_19.783144_16_plen_71_part_00